MTAYQGWKFCHIFSFLNHHTGFHVAGGCRGLKCAVMTAVAHTAGDLRAALGIRVESESVPEQPLEPLTLNYPLT